MSNKNNGGPAFPGKWNQNGVHGNEGMNMRDYFAAKAMQSFIVSWPDDHQVNAPLLTKMSYQIADAMLAERAK